MSERPERRIAILGTAPTWRECPWDDPTLECWALNDMWVLKPKRADRWFDLHPFDKMYFRDPNKKMSESQVPAGYFVRPAGHLEWLKKQTIPVYLADAPPDWVNAKTFPRAEIEARFGTDFASTPAWMMALAIMEGATEIHIYGIHLATEWEYIRQKPNLLFFMGLAAGLGIKLVLPKGCPLLKQSHRYAYEEDPDTPKVALQRKIQMLQGHLAQQKAAKGDPNRASRVALLEAQILDCQVAIQRAMAGRVPAGV